MSLFAAIGVLLIILAIVHLVPLALGLVVGVILTCLGGAPLYSRGRRRGPPW